MNARKGYTEAEDQQIINVLRENGGKPYAAAITITDMLQAGHPNPLQGRSIEAIRRRSARLIKMGRLHRNDL